MVVLSLFDGIGCGRLALKKARISVDKYYASEIDKYAIEISKKNHKKIVQLGDIKNWREWDLEIPDLIIGGSPCQGFSNAGQRLNFEDTRSKLFFDFVDVLKYYRKKNPNIFFLLENVKMKKEWQNIITDILGVPPVELNSAIVSAQQRKRLYWCNWSVNKPRKRNICLKDIIEPGIESGIVDRDKSYCIDANHYYEKPERVGVLGKGGQGQRIYDIQGKSVALGANGGGQGAKTGLYAIAQRGRNLNAEGKGVDGKGAKTKQRFETSYSEKGNCLTSVQKDSLLLDMDTEKYIIRKLTPVECERLQTLPDNYTEGVSNNQRYKMLGNAWTVDIIAYIFRRIRRKDDG